MFNQGVVDEEEVFQKAQLKSWLWLKHKGNNFNYSFSDSDGFPMSSSWMFAEDGVEA